MIKRFFLFELLKFFFISFLIAFSLTGCSTNNSVVPELAGIPKVEINK